MKASLSLNKRMKLAAEAIEELNKINPDPRCELIYHTPYQLLVSVVLSAKNSDMMVNRVMGPLYEGEFTPETVVALGVDGLLAKIRQIGLAPTKARRVVALSQILLDQYAGNIPDTREGLESLPGVGRKTANVVLGEIFGEPTLAVDTHVFRVTRRLGLQDCSTPDKAEFELLKVMDKGLLPGGHRHFILHGRHTCKALHPQCGSCVLARLCPSEGRP
jgi:endonuclease-3